MNANRPLHLAKRTALWSVVCGLWSLSAAGQSTIDLTNTWSAPGVAGWTNTATAEVQLSNPGGYLNMAHAKQWTPEFVEDTTLRQVNRGVLVTNVAFAFRATDIAPSALRLYLHARGSGHTWFVILSPPAAGETRAYDVPVAYAAGWRLGPESPLALFEDDIRDVDWVGVYVRRHGDTAIQNYALDDFRLVGMMYPQDLDLDGMDDAWEIQNGLDPDSAADAMQDADGDGMVNYAEYRAGTNPRDPLSLFRVQMEARRPAEGAGVRLWWQSMAARTYTVWRTDGLGKPFEAAERGIGAQPPTNWWTDASATNSGAVFYRIEVEP